VPAAAGEEEAAGREVGLDLVWWLLLSAYIVYIGAMDLRLHIRITYLYFYLHTYNLTHHFYTYTFRDVYTTVSTWNDLSSKVPPAHEWGNRTPNASNSFFKALLVLL